MTTVANLQAVLSVDSAAAERAFASISDHADHMKDKVGGAGQALVAIGGVAAAGLAVAAGAAVGAVAAFAGFEQVVSAIGAVSGASKEELDALSQTALKLGKETSFSAKEAAQGMEELAKAGLSTADIIGGGAAAALNLAAAGGVNVAEAAAIASTAMTVFNVKAEDMGAVTDKIAGFANATAGSVTDFKFALASTGAVANMMGASFDDTATAISLMGKAGILGSDAGTSLKTMFMNLVPQTKAAKAEMQSLGIIVGGQNRFFDEATGKLKGMDEVAGILAETVGKLGVEEQITALHTLFGTDAIRASTIMTHAGAEGFRAMAEEISKVSAADVAKQRLDNLNGSIEQMKGSAETLAIIFGAKLAPGVRVAVDAVTSFLNELIDNQGLQDFVEMLGVHLGNAIQMAVMGFGNLTSALGALHGVLTSTGGDRAGFLEALGLTPELAQDVGAILDRVQMAFDTFSNDWQDGFRALGDVAGEIATFLTPIAEAAFQWVRDQSRALDNQLLAWAQAFVDWVEPLIPPMLDALGQAATALLGWAVDQIGPLTDQLLAWGTAFVAWVQPQIQPMLDQLGTLASQAIAWVGEQLPGFMEQLAAWGEAFVTWVIPHLGPMLEQLASLGVALIGWVVETTVTLTGQLLQWGLAFVEWLAPHIPELIAKCMELQGRLGEWIVGTALPALIAQLVTWGEAFVNWVDPSIGPMMGKLNGMAAQMFDWISATAASLFERASALGYAIVDGMTGGMLSKIGSVASAAAQLGAAAIDAARAAIDSHSPSIEFYDIGRDIVDGLVEGIDKEGHRAVEGVEAWINSILAGASTAIGGIPSTVFAKLGEGAAKGFVLGLLGQQQNVIEEALTLVEGSAISFTGAILDKMGDLSVEQSRRIRDAVQSAAKAQQEAIDKTVQAAAKYDAVFAAIGQKAHDAAVAAAQDAAIAADKAIEVSARAAIKVQELVADTLAKNSADAQKAIEKAAKDAEAAAKKTAQEVAKAAQDALKAEMDAVKDFKDFLKAELPAIGRQMADSLDLMGAVIKDMLSPAHMTEAQTQLLRAAKEWKKALGGEFKPGQMTPILADWMPKANDPKLIKQMKDLAKGLGDAYMDTVRTALQGGDYFIGHFDFLANEMVSGSGKIGAFFTKTLAAFADGGKKAGQAFTDGVVHSIEQLNNLPALNLDNLLPGQTSKPPGNGLAAASTLEASYAGQFAGMTADELKAFFAQKGLPADFSQYAVGNQTLDQLRTALAQYFAGLLASGVWSAIGGFRPVIDAENSPFGKDPTLQGGGTNQGGAPGTGSAGVGGINSGDIRGRLASLTPAYSGLSGSSSTTTSGGNLRSLVQSAVADAFAALTVNVQQPITVNVGSEHIDTVIARSQARAIRRTY